MDTLTPFEKRVDGMLALMLEGFSDMAQRFNVLEERLSDLEEQIALLREEIGQMKQELVELRAEVRANHLEYTGTRNAVRSSGKLLVEA